MHLVWATRERQPLITPALQRMVYSCILAECKALKADAVALGGMPDHVHLLARLPAALAVAALVKQVKGSTSHLMSHGLDERVGFKWQGGYGTFTVAKRDVAAIRSYIEQQEQHHTSGMLWPGAERSES